MIKSKTSLFMQYRKSYRKNTAPSDAAPLLDIPLSVLPPKYVDELYEIDQSLSQNKQRIEYLQNRLKTSLTGVDDLEMKKIIEGINQAIQQIQFRIDKIHHTDSLAGNIRQGLLLKLQSNIKLYQSIQTKIIQNQLPSLPASNGGGNTSPTGDSLLQEYQLDLVQVPSDRSREIEQVSDSIKEMAQVFQQINHLILEQGSMVDRIDQNIENTLEAIQGANEELAQVHLITYVGCEIPGKCNQEKHNIYACLVCICSNYYTNNKKQEVVSI
eukprot:NODE_151_length_17042_cov_0.275925.p5 type:complete len:270 gc:universal NODE_151_length_17042_cov_0.275925:2859-3668(+)